ncbi:restriction endonuclease subunit S [Saccharopolyspora sp. NPDC047091]|uniref:restriction endonuclease subunit S n=1 Tax=Saccharopolyspora sp. NPDC047091 TaxID=3155924 RepID=UPI0033F1C09E
MNTIELGKITTWLSGGTPSRVIESYWNGDIPWISAFTLKQTRLSDSDQHLTRAGVAAGSKLAPEGATLILVRGMALHREVRVGTATRPLAFNQDVKALIPSSGVDPEFLVYSLQARADVIRGLVSSAGSGTGVLDTPRLKRLKLWVPSKDEQIRMREAITDAESQCGALELLIAKKRDVKRAMMEEILTGRIRLPGYSEAWIERPVSDLLEFKNGLNKASQFFGHGTPIVNFMDVMRAPVITADRVKGLVSLSRDEVSRFSARRGDMFFTRTSESVDEIGTTAVLVDDVRDAVFSGFVLRGRPIAPVNTTFLAYQFQLPSVRRQVVATASYTTRALTNGGSLGRVRVHLPSSDEQAAIVAVLADADAELAALERRLESARAVKTGMMRELFTGRTRLPAEAAS